MLRLPFVAILLATTFSHSSAQTVTTTRLHEWCSSQSGTTEDTSCTAFMAVASPDSYMAKQLGASVCALQMKSQVGRCGKSLRGTPTITLNSWISRLV